MMAKWRIREPGQYTRYYRTEAGAYAAWEILEGQVYATLERRVPDWNRWSVVAQSERGKCDPFVQQ